MRKAVVRPEERPNLVIEGEDDSEGEQDLQQAQEDVVNQIVVASPVLKISGFGEINNK